MISEMFACRTSILERERAYHELVERDKNLSAHIQDLPSDIMSLKVQVT